MVNTTCAFHTAPAGRRAGATAEEDAELYGRKLLSGQVGMDALSIPI